MRPRSIRASFRGQGGYALLAAVALVGAAALYVFVSGLNAQASLSAREAETQRALSEAKEALLARAVTDLNRPGSLPCPDLDGDGDADLFYGTECPSYLGRLPIRTLGLPRLPDAYGERLWYAVSRNFRDSQAAQPINAATPATLSIGGGVADIAAVIVAPGPPTAHQHGRPSNAVTDYLEGENADGDDIFATAQSASNDRLIYITRGELMSRVSDRILAEVAGRSVPASARGLLGYAAQSSGMFPWPDQNGDGIADAPPGTRNRIPYQDLTFPTIKDREGNDVPVVKNMLLNNDWFSLIAYRVSAGRDRATIALGTKHRSLP